MVVVSKCLGGDHCAEPDWFHRDTYARDVALFREILQDDHQRMAENNVLVAFHGSNGKIFVNRLTMVSSLTGLHMLSDEALELFPQDTPEKRMKLEMLLGGCPPEKGMKLEKCC